MCLFLGALNHAPSSAPRSRLVLFADRCIPLFQFLQLFVRKVFNINHVVVRRTVGANQFVKLKVKGFGVTVLSILNQENHKESNNGGTSIDNELPGVGELEEWPARCPYYQRNQGAQEHHRMPNQSRDRASKTAEPEIQGV